ncbi:MAG: hypothetical protein AUG51_01950 [Acidobacteria bacterium 13_1_20CM_3_53_8]|nr:MAG: hypothetical protein AUG51_01950 [Acidobacteria bacterium 13_1_20CM_3_53_8]
MLAACLIACLPAITATAQSLDARTRKVQIAVGPYGVSRLENELSVDADEINIELGEAPRPPASISTPRPARFNQLLLSAIDQRIGAPYVYGATGPRVFDCSGFVWSVFQSVGINFERGSARAFWSEFAPARQNEEYKFGTLVFFSGLSHIGIVADEHGFYHASRSHGVTYSPFNDYWLSRIDGFRRIPVPVQNLAE